MVGCLVSFGLQEILWSLLQLLATAVLTLFARRGISANVSTERLAAFLQNILTDTAEVQFHYLYCE